LNADATGNAELGGTNRLRSDDVNAPDAAATDEDDEDATLGATSNVLGAFDEAVETGGEESNAEDNNADDVAAGIDACASAATDAGSGDNGIDDAAAANTSTDGPALFCCLC
jgi:hypothetical protein